MTRPLPISLVISRRPDDSAQALALRAWDRLRSTYPQPVSLLLDPQVRRSSRSTGLGRDLPYVRDLLELADLEGDWQTHPEWRTDHWIGLVNSDIIPTKRLIEGIAKVPIGVESIHIHRTDVDGLVAQKNPVVDLASVDGWLIKSSVWRHHDATGEAFPDFLLGEPGWGYATTLWTTSQGIWSMHLNDLGLCYHVRHRSVWKDRKSLPRKLNKSLWHNQQLYARLEQQTGLKMDERTGLAVRK